VTVRAKRAETVRTLDIAPLKEIFGDDPVAIASTLREFSRVLPGDLADLTRAVIDCDLDATEEAAHRMKGAARIVGAGAVVACCQAIEKAAVARSWLDIKAEMLRLTLEAAELKNAVAERIAAVPVQGQRA
jgi:HPt (histidine-containing phosphotransfer) domain-containing protein